MSLYMNELGEFVDRDSDAEAEKRRRRVYANLRAVDTSGLRAEAREAVCEAVEERRMKRTYRGAVGDVIDCPVCGVRFTRMRRDQRCCSEKCSQVLCQRERRHREPVEATCPMCGEKFEKRHGNRKYCSILCKNRAYERKRRKK